MKRLEIKVVTTNVSQLQMAINILKDNLYDFIYIDSDNLYHTFSDKLSTMPDDELLILDYKDTLGIIDEFIDNSLLNVLSSEYKREYIVRKNSFMKEYEEARDSMYLNESYITGSIALCLNLDSSKDAASALLKKDYFFTTICAISKGKGNTYAARDGDDCYFIARCFKNMDDGDKKVLISYNDAVDHLLEVKDTLNIKPKELNKITDNLKREFIEFVNKEHAL